jgi:hypothetical protein
LESFALQVDEVYTLVQQCKLSYDSKLRSALC